MRIHDFSFASIKHTIWGADNTNTKWMEFIIGQEFKFILDLGFTRKQFHYGAKGKAVQSSWMHQ